MYKPSLLDRFKGCLVGLACGDYLGMPVEFMDRSGVRGYFGELGVRPTACKHRGGKSRPAGYYTDDTAMTICIAESLIEKGFDVEDQFERFKRWLHEGYATPDGDKALGVGQNTLRALLWGNPTKQDTDINNNTKSGGNGALMRCSPIGLLYHKSKEDILEKTYRSTITTHNNNMAVWTSIAHNNFIGYALLGFEKDSFTERFIQSHPACPLELKNALRINFAALNEIDVDTSGYTLNTLVVSLYAFHTTSNYRDCVSKAILLGGDTDTQGTVSGSIAGSYYGISDIPDIWTSTLINKAHIMNLASDFFRNSI